MEKIKKKLDLETKKKLVIGGAIFLVALVFISLYSTSTSPLFPYYYGSDSAQFQTMGMAWAAGKVPYRDIFDHKGPMAFFFDMLSFKMFGNNVGIYLVQVVCMFINLAAVYQISQLYFKGTFTGFLSIAITCIIFAAEFLGGNFGEEYCLPLIFVSTYFQLRYFRNNEITHKPIYALIYGVAFGISFFSKATNAIALCIGVLIIIINIVAHKEFKNLWKNAYMFIAGFMIIALPFSIYFLANGCFGDMMYAMIEFNVTYQIVMGSWVETSDGNTWYQFVQYYFPYYCVIFTGIINIRNREWKTLAYNVLILIIGGYLFFDGTLGYQYMFMMIPNIVILLGHTYALPSSNKDMNFAQIAIMIMIIALCHDFIPGLVRTPVDMRRGYLGKSERVYEALLVQVPEDERDSFIAYGGSDLKDLYLLNNIIPCYKYFVLQSWHCCFNKKTYKDVQDTFQNGNAKWILADENIGVIEDTIYSRYYPVDTHEGFTLYHIIE